MIEKRIATSQQEGVRLHFGHLDREFAWFHSIHTETPPFDDLSVAQFGQCDHGTSMRDLEFGNPVVSVEVTRNIVDPNEIQVIYPDSLEAVFDRPGGAVCRVVIHDLVLSAVLEEIAFFSESLHLLLNLIEDEPADFAAKEIVRASVLR